MNTTSMIWTVAVAAAAAAAALALVAIASEYDAMFTLMAVALLAITAMSSYLAWKAGEDYRVITGEDGKVRCLKLKRPGAPANGASAGKSPKGKMPGGKLPKGKMPG
ncbi:MAG: hypothetical protein LBS92_07855 [Candidatus Methanoplasma sp.]|jgi:hypothetical protein|nr:hypothetical protein [Candidatus Methanoplasma sp.]